MNRTGLVEELGKLEELEQRATPGPWRADLEEAGEESSEVRAEGGTLVANVYGRNDFPCITDEDPAEAPVSEFFANAVLVEESRNIFPELLECAKSLAEIDGLGKELSREEFQRWTDARKRARAAVDALQNKLTSRDSTASSPAYSVAETTHSAVHEQDGK